MLELIAELAVGVGTAPVRVAHFTHGRREHDALVAVTSALHVYYRQLAVLGRVVTGKHGHYALGTRYLTRVYHGGGETSVHSVIGTLRSAVAVHGKERLGEDVASVVMVGARVYDTSVVHYGGRQGVRLIETYTTHVSAVAVADEKVADLGWGVAGGDGGPGGGEQYIAVGKIAAFIVGIPVL